jgi:adenylyltransferase/sulfurtransferase
VTALDARTALSDPALLEPLRAHAMAWYPRECCALIVDGARRPELILADNEADRWHAADRRAFPRTAARAYVLDPRLLVRAEAAGKRVVAIVHSHVDVGAYFSDEDERLACTPDGAAPLFPGVDHVVLDARADGVRGFKTFTWSDAARGFVER